MLPPPLVDKAMPGVMPTIEPLQVFPNVTISTSSERKEKN